MKNEFLDKWLQYDHNPFMVFSKNGKVLYSNESAEYMLSLLDIKIIFQIVIDRAPKNPSFQYVRENFIFNNVVYDCALIGYETFEEIGVRFYKKLEEQKLHRFEELEELNLFMILDLCRTYVFMEDTPTFKDYYDIDLPNILANKENLIKLLSELYSFFIGSKKISTEVKIKVGEKIIIDNKKYNIAQVSISGDVSKIKQINNYGFDVKFYNDKVVLFLTF